MLNFGEFGPDDYQKLMLGMQMADDVDDISPGRQFDQPDLYKSYWGTPDEKKEENEEDLPDADFGGRLTDDFEDDTDYFEDDDELDSIGDEYQENMDTLHMIDELLMLSNAPSMLVSCRECWNRHEGAASGGDGPDCDYAEEVANAMQSARMRGKRYPFTLRDLKTQEPGAYCWHFRNGDIDFSDKVM